jgi:predicted metal-dependent RNase
MMLAGTGDESQHVSGPYECPTTATHPRVILTHGEDAARAAMARLVEQQLRIKPEIPKFGDVIVH